MIRLAIAALCLVTIVLGAAPTYVQRPVVGKWSGSMAPSYKLAMSAPGREIQAVIHQCQSIDEFVLHEKVGNVSFSRKLHTFKEGHVKINDAHYVIGSYSAGGRSMHTLGQYDPIIQVTGFTPYSSTPKKSRRKRAAPLYTVDMLVVVDQELVKFLHGISKSSPATEQFDVTHFFHKYYAMIIASTSQYLKTLTKHRVHFRCRGAGLVILNKLLGNRADFEAFPPLITSERYTITALPYLKALSTYLADEKMSFDHATLLTGYDIRREDGSYRQLSGLNMVTGKVCTPSAVSIVQASVTHIDAALTSHELGHSLGAPHDLSDCPDPGIMSPGVEIDQHIKLERFHNFSSCTAHYITANIKENLKGRGNCLLRTTIKNDLVDPFLGTSMSLQQQCYTSAHALEVEDTPSPCHHVTCKGGPISSSYRHRIIPFNGTPCKDTGSRFIKRPMWCIDGYCKKAT